MVARTLLLCAVCVFCISAATPTLANEQAEAQQAAEKAAAEAAYAAQAASEIHVISEQALAEARAAIDEVMASLEESGDLSADGAARLREALAAAEAKLDEASGYRQFYFQHEMPAVPQFEFKNFSEGGHYTPMTMEQLDLLRETYPDLQGIPSGAELKALTEEALAGALRAAPFAGAQPLTPDQRAKIELELKNAQTKLDGLQMYTLPQLELHALPSLAPEAMKELEFELKQIQGFAPQALAQLDQERSLLGTGPAGLSEEQWAELSAEVEQLVREILAETEEIEEEAESQ